MMLPPPTERFCSWWLRCCCCCCCCWLVVIVVHRALCQDWSIGKRGRRKMLWRRRWRSCCLFINRWCRECQVVSDVEIKWSLRHGADTITTIYLFLTAIEGMVISYMHKKWESWCFIFICTPRPRNVGYGSYSSHHPSSS